jgi:hypothetical protein
MMIPLVHLNGTGKEELLDQLGVAEAAMRVAMAAVHKASPNARDYYPIGPDAYTQARNEHAARMGSLKAVQQQLEDLYVAVAAGGWRRS